MVIRRVGGLEDMPQCHQVGHEVIRRVGGLEVFTDARSASSSVIRRVGGLEVFLRKQIRREIVIRRVGGLDCQKLRPHSAAGAFVLEHVQGEADADFRLSSPYGIPHSPHIGR